jgi:hypothetical protein
VVAENPARAAEEIQTSLQMPGGVEIFRDPDLDRSGRFATQLGSGASSAGVLLVVLTPNDLQSEWCEKERKWFIDTITKDGRQDDIFIARTFPVERDKWPAELQPSGIPFTRRTARKPPNRNCAGWTTTTQSQFQDSVIDLAGDIAQRLRGLKQRNDALRAVRAGYGPLDKQAVYLYARPEHALQRSTIRAALSPCFTVLPSDGCGTACRRP